MACFSHIEGWYNPVRLYSGLGCRFPMAYEEDTKPTLAEA
jgi:putative transposase